MITAIVNRDSAGTLGPLTPQHDGQFASSVIPLATTPTITVGLTAAAAGGGLFAGGFAIGHAL